MYLWCTCGGGGAWKMKRRSWKGVRLFGETPNSDRQPACCCAGNMETKKIKMLVSYICMYNPRYIYIYVYIYVTEYLEEILNDTNRQQVLLLLYPPATGGSARSLWKNPPARSENRLPACSAWLTRSNFLWLGQISCMGAMIIMWNFGDTAYTEKT